ncbi:MULTISPECIES: exosortase N [Flavobacterium]|uniref:exosortase N n=1 Tax=Flavobacterium TaxID=237 RepID=UPI001642A61F|nr:MULTISPECIES: exosortase N [Flavobacterium]MCR4033310.1 exosortase N [Flavobacterium panacis]
MKYLSLQYKKPLAILITIVVLLLNYGIIKKNLDSNFIGILFSIVLFIIGGRKTNLNLNYPLVGLIFILEFISFRLHTKSLHFLALAIFVCFMYYKITGKFSFIAFFCIVLFSSLFNTFFNFLTTEIKQTLCYTVFLTLKNVITIDKIEGVNFYINNAKITVDTACMGLSMFKTGLLTGAFLLTLEERKQQNYFSIKQIILFCLIVITLNIVSNYFRIVILILFNCTKENMLHHSIGLFCFIVYQIVPMLFLIRYFKPTQKELSKANKKLILGPAILVTFIVILCTSLKIQTDSNDDLLENLNPQYNIQQGNWVNKEVFKISTSEKLIYIKTPAHKPLICWTGDGYSITESKETKRNNEEIWQIKIEKNNKKYVSYWWYECDGKKYTSLIKVLLIKLIHNKPVRLINETFKTPL